MKQKAVLTKVMVGIILMFLFAYIIFSTYRYFSKPYDFVRVFHGVMEYSMESDGVVVRDEVPLKEVNTVVGYEVNEGEKVRAGQVVAIAYESEETRIKQQKIEDLQRQIDQISYAIDHMSLAGVALTQESHALQSRLHSLASSGNFKQSYDEIDAHKKMVLRRAYLQSEEAEEQLGMTFLSARQEILALEKSIKPEAKPIYAPQAGLFSSYLDGYERLLTPEAIAQVTSKEAFWSLCKQEPAGRAGVGKVVTSSKWKVGIVIDEESAKQFLKSWNVRVRFSSLQESVKMKIEEKKQLEEGNYLVIMRSQENMHNALSLREQAVSIVFQSEEGIRIPKEALRVRDDGTIGVYTVTAYRAEFKPVVVLAEDESAYIVKTPKTDKKTKHIIRSNDEVIITNLELYEGKVVR